MKISKVRHACPEFKDLEKTIRSKDILNDFVFLHFWNPMQISYHGKVITTFPNACIIFSPGELLHLVSKDSGVHDLIHISSDISELLKSYDIEPNRIYYPKNDDFITDMVHKLGVENRSGDLYSDKLCECLLNEFFIRLSREIKLANNNDNLDGHTEEQFKRLRKLLHCDYTKHWEISEMARHINLSPSYLYSVYKKLYGVSPLQDLINIRIQYAKNMLTESRKSVSDIAALLGYSSSSHFIRQFTKNVGVSPLKYRQSNFKEHKKDIKDD